MLTADLAGYHAADSDICPFPEGLLNNCFDFEFIVDDIPFQFDIENRSQDFDTTTIDGKAINAMRRP